MGPVAYRPGWSAERAQMVLAELLVRLLLPEVLAGRAPRLAIGPPIGIVPPHTW